MSRMPESVAEFLSGKRIAVAGVSRSAAGVGNAVFRKLRRSGYEVFPINPNAAEVEGVTCYPNVGAVPTPLDGLVITTHPDAAADLVLQCAAHGVKRVWLHRAVGAGSVSPGALLEGQSRGVKCIEGGCPLMYCEPVDFAHKCMRWWLARSGRVPR